MDFILIQVSAYLFKIMSYVLSSKSANEFNPLIHIAPEFAMYVSPLPAYGATDSDNKVFIIPLS